MSEQVDLPHGNLSLSQLRSYLTTIVHPDNEEYALALDKSAWSVNEDMISPELEHTVVLKGGETVCPIPPVSGG